MIKTHMKGFAQYPEQQQVLIWMNKFDSFSLFHTGSGTPQGTGHILAGFLIVAHLPYKALSLPAYELLKTESTTFPYQTHHPHV